MIKMNEKEFKNYFSNNIKSISSKLSLEEINFLCNLVNAFNEVCEKYDKSQNNWNELKKWIEEDTEVAETNFEMGRCFNMFDLLNKMQELEGNNE